MHYEAGGYEVSKVCFMNEWALMAGGLNSRRGQVVCKERRGLGAKVVIPVGIIVCELSPVEDGGGVIGTGGSWIIHSRCHRGHVNRIDVFRQAE